MSLSLSRSPPLCSPNSVAIFFFIVRTAAPCCREFADTRASLHAHSACSIHLLTRAASSRWRGTGEKPSELRRNVPSSPSIPTRTPPLFQPLYVLVRGWFRYSFIHGYSRQHDSFAARLEPYRICSSDRDKSSSFLHLYLLDLFAICRRRRNCEVLTSCNTYFLWFQYRRDGFAVGVRYFSSWILMLEL